MILGMFLMVFGLVNRNNFLILLDNGQKTNQLGRYIYGTNRH